MSRWLPMPVSSLLVFVGWILIMGELSPLAVIGAAFFAIVLPWLARPFVPANLGLSNPLGVIRLIGVVIYDIIQSNLMVARLVLGNPDNLRPAFITVPVDTDHPFVVNLVASIITMTPGTVSARVSEQPGSAAIVVHVLDCDDEQALIDDIKTRYEKPLLEIFGC